MSAEESGALTEGASPAEDLPPGPQRPPLLLMVVAALILLLVPIVVAVRLNGPLDDPDVLWHLLLGRHLRATWDFGPADPLSPLTTLPWVYNQWLPEVVASIAEDVGGLPAVAWLTTAGRLTLFAAVWWSCRRRAGEVAALLAAVVGYVGTFGAFGPRPQLVGMILMVVAVDAWLRTADDGRPRWWLVPLTWLWACSHGTWTIGTALGAVVALALLLDRRGDPWTQHAQRLAIPVLSVAAAALTPVGPRLLANLGMVNDISDLISEWQPPSLTQFMMAFTVAGLGLTVLIWLRRTDGRPSWARLAVLALATGASLMYVRTVAVGAILMAPLLAEALQSLVPRERTRASRLEWVALTAGLALALTYSAVTLPTLAREPARTPLQLSDELAALPAGVIYNEQFLGGWLPWAHPHLTPVIDTRSETFGREAVEAWIDTEAARGGWEERFDATGARLALLEEKSALASALLGQRGWRTLGSDNGYVLLKAP